jgi:hypothetical protein
VLLKHKKQHFIPACYLKAWCDPRCPKGQTPYVWVFEKESKTGTRKASDNIFHESDMYTLYDEEGHRDLVIEHGLRQLEGQFAALRKKKLRRQIQLDNNEHFLLCVFIAAIHARTKSQLKHLRDQWRQPLEMMKSMEERITAATEEERRTMARLSTTHSSEYKKGLNTDEVRAIVENPVATMLLPMINAEAKLLPRLDFAILYADANPGFITSDSPCIWFDSEAYKRPPMYRTPALMYETIEISLTLTHPVPLS